MLRNTIALVIVNGFFLLACKDEIKDLPTKSITIGDKKCVVQRMPADFQEGSGDKESNFDYFRIVIESKAPMLDSSHVNYVNFGIENSIKKVSKADTLLPAFVQRIANGKKNNYEYLVSFEKNNKEENFEILIDDEVFEIGLVSIKF